MANLLRLTSLLDNLSIKFSYDRTICSKIIKLPENKNFKVNRNWRCFTEKNGPSKEGKSLSWCLKISLGLGMGAGIKMLSNNKVFCRANLDAGTRLVDNRKSVKEPKFNWRKFFALLKPYWPELLGAILAAVICALLNIQIPRALGSVIDVLTKISDSKEGFIEIMKQPALTLISYYSLQSLFTFIYISLLSNVGEGVAKTMKMKMFSSILEQDIAFFDYNRTGEILNRMTVDIQDFKSSFKMIISQGLRNFTQIVGCSLSLLFISPFMTGIMMVAVPSAILGGTIVGSLLRQLSFQAKAQGGKVTLAAEEAISNIRTVRSFAMEDVEYKIVDDQAEIFKRLNIKLGYGIAMFQAATSFFLNGMVLSTIYLGGYMMTVGNITAGDLMAFLVATQILQRSFTQMSLLFGYYIKGKHAGARVFEMIDLPPGRTLGSGKIIPFHSLIPDVEFKDVVFSYPTRPNKRVLNNINLKIPEGKTVAIVGSSGSGKSTMAWLLERFYDVNGGAIIVGGEDVRKLDSNWLRKNVIGFISQEPILFATTVMENIRYGNPSATNEEVIAAAKMANADKFIMEFPEGYNTMVGERGVSVSGGQKQRIAIARALLKNPSILILDEATSALDSESEKTVQQALDNVTKSRTTIVIAHRLCTIKNADLIVVLRDGVIVESGTHQELLAKKGMYFTLIQQQMQDK